MLITLSLVLSASQVYRIQAKSAAIQEVADVCALAAENQVANYYTVVRVCDAALLSMTLTSVISGALGIATLCTPFTAPYSSSLLSTSRQILKTRDTFAQSAADNLNRWQQLLPFIASASAYTCAKANSNSDSSYLAIAILCPFEGEMISFGASMDDSLIKEVERESDDVADSFAEAEELAQDANDAKHKAWLHDYGNVLYGTQRYCAYERAAHLAQLSGMSNQTYRAEQTWTFQKAINRARAYYQARIKLDSIPIENDIEEESNRFLRYTYYTYAYQEMKKAYATEDGDSFKCYFPVLPKSMSEVRSTNLYTQDVLPASSGSASGQLVVHSTPNCPQAASVSEWVSLSDCEHNHYAYCTACQFEITDLTDVVAATSVVQTGFEYHYRIIADCANRYKQSYNNAHQTAAPEKRSITEWLSELAETAKSAINRRITPEPPGRNGVIALVVDTKQRISASTPSTFVDYRGTIGIQVALSAAVLQEEEAQGSSSVIANLLDGLTQNTFGFPYVLQLILRLWNGILTGYANGLSGITSVAKSVFDALPWQSSLGLGTWVAGKFTSAINGIGLQAPTLSTAKAVLAPTIDVAKQAESGIAARFTYVQKAALALGGDTQQLSDLVALATDGSLQALGISGNRFLIATLYPLGPNGPSIPLSITLPIEDIKRGIVDSATQAIESLLSRIRNTPGSGSSVQKRWS